MPLANKIKYVGCVTLLSVAWLLWFPHPLVPRLWKMQPHLLLCHPVSPGPAEILPTGSLHVQRLCGFFTAKLLQASGSFGGGTQDLFPPGNPKSAPFYLDTGLREPIRYNLLHAFPLLRKEDPASSLHFGVLQKFLRQNLQSDSYLLESCKENKTKQTKIR